MSILSNITAGLSNAEKFLLSLVSKAQALGTVYSKLSPGVIGAAAAVFYDAVKTVSSAEATAAAVETDNLPLSITLSSTTASLLKQTVTDFKAGVAVVKADFESLNLSI